MELVRACYENLMWEIYSHLNVANIEPYFEMTPKYDTEKSPPKNVYDFLSPF